MVCMRTSTHHWLVYVDVRGMSAFDEKGKGVLSVSGRRGVFCAGGIAILHGR